MKGDFSRFTFDPQKHYSAVRMQQGRVQLDADWNEQLDISQHRLAKQMSDFIGYSGVPIGGEGENGFQISEISGNNFTIGAGRIYVAGELYENETEVLFDAQPDYPDAAKELEGLQNTTYVAYLDVWQRHITPLEDPDIGEVALRGADTATRVKNVWQVKLVKEGEWTGDLSSPDWKPNDVEPISTGKMKAQVTAGAALENQLYRVEIHNGGNADLKIFPGPTFKWSRDNGAVAARVSGIDSENKTITVNSAGRDPEMGFASQQWIELRSEAQTLTGEPGTLYYLDKVQGNELTVEDPNNLLPSDLRNETWIARRWDSQAGNNEKGDFSILTDWQTLESEIRVQFQTENGDTYNTGDYWLIPARSLTGTIEWPTDGDGFQPPRGIQHHYVPLATLIWNDTNSSWNDSSQDLRPTFSSLVGGVGSKWTSSGSDIYYDGGKVGIGTSTLDESAALTVEGQIKFGTGADKLFTLGASTGMRVVAGVVDENGQIVNGTEGFSSKNEKLGVYLIEFTQTFSQQPIFVCSPLRDQGDADVYMCFAEYFDKKYKVYLFKKPINSANNEEINRAFSFISFFQ